MKKIFLLALLLFGSIGLLQAQDHQTILQKADELRIQKKYSEALLWIQKNITVYPKTKGNSRLRDERNPVEELQKLIILLVNTPHLHEKQADAIALLHLQNNMH